MIELDASLIAMITNGKLVRSSDTAIRIKQISTDSRIIEEGSCFLALRGEHFDGHDFIPDVLHKGIKDICVETMTCLPQTGHYNAILVTDTLKAYQDIAAWQRANHGYKVIGITGSVGKTSTREMVRAALHESLKVHTTKQNFNNQIGLPQSILNAPDDSEVCVLEMGMRALGEIHELTLIAKPDIAIITNIGFSHIEYLKSKENIFRAKKEIMEGLKQGGLAILNADDPYLASYKKPKKRHRICFVTAQGVKKSNADLFLTAKDIVSDRTGLRFQVDIRDHTGRQTLTKTVCLPFPGKHHVTNALFALAVSYEMNLDLEQCIRGIGKYQAITGRQTLIQDETIHLIDDSYNASPESMAAALSLLHDISQGRRKIAVLGGMLELGDYSIQEHRNVGALCVQTGVQVVYVYGETARPVIEGIEDTIQEATTKESESCRINSIEYHYYDDMDSLLASLRKKIRKGDSILVKGSRLFRMETVVHDLESRYFNEKRGDV